MPRRARKKKELVKVEWRRMLETEPLVDELVKKHHRHLERAKIVILGKPKAGKAHGKVRVATARKAPAGLNALVKDEIGEVHYIIEIGLDAWDKLTPKGRRIVLDHELCHFAGQDEAGRWGMLGHDVEEFTAILERHGAYRPELEIFVRAAKQLELPLAS